MFEESTRMAAELGHSNAWEDPKTKVKKKGGALGFMYEAPPGYIPDEEGSAAMVKRIVGDKEDKEEEGAEKEEEEPVAEVAEKGGEDEGKRGPDPRSIQPLGVQVSSCGSPLTMCIGVKTGAELAPVVLRICFSSLEAAQPWLIHQHGQRADRARLKLQKIKTGMKHHHHRPAHHIIRGGCSRNP